MLEQSWGSPQEQREDPKETVNFGVSGTKHCGAVGCDICAPWMWGLVPLEPRDVYRVIPQSFNTYVSLLCAGPFIFLETGDVSVHSVPPAVGDTSNRQV